MAKEVAADLLEAEAYRRAVHFPSGFLIVFCCWPPISSLKVPNRFLHQFGYGHIGLRRHESSIAGEARLVCEPREAPF